MRKVAFSLRLAGLVLATSALAVGPVEAAATLSLTPGSGPPGSTFDAAYGFTPPSAQPCPAGGTVDFWWDAEGPAGPNPPGAAKLGQAALLAFNCTARAALQVPAAAPCGAHTVFAFIDNRNGGPSPGTTSSIGFIVAGCPTPPPPTATPASPTASSPRASQSSVPPSASASATAAPTQSSTPRPEPSTFTFSSGPPVGGPPSPAPAGPGAGSAAVVALIGAALLLGIWAVLYFRRFR